jgi:hypothetical protein
MDTQVTFVQIILNVILKFLKRITDIREGTATFLFFKAFYALSKNCEK